MPVLYPSKLAAAVNIGCHMDRARYQREQAAIAVPGMGGDVVVGSDPSMRLRATERCETLQNAADHALDLEALRRPKRIRSRHKPLTAADIVKGGEYVPKRGNDKSPTYCVTFVSSCGVNALRSGESLGCERFYFLPDFLALVARRVQP